MGPQLITLCVVSTMLASTLAFRGASHLPLKRPARVQHQGPSITMADGSKRAKLKQLWDNMVSSDPESAKEAAITGVIEVEEPVQQTEKRRGVIPDDGSFTPSNDFLPASVLERAAAGNKFEKVKLKKCGTAAWSDVHEFSAAVRSGEYGYEDIMGDDRDIRLKWAGIFSRFKRTPGKYMLRLKVPNGILTSQQMRLLAESVAKYGTSEDIVACGGHTEGDVYNAPEGSTGGCVDITTRMNIQLRGVETEDLADVFDGISSVGLTSRQTGLDNVRNLVGSPLAGIDPNEIVDTRPFCTDIQALIVGHDGMGRTEFANLGRKFNIAVSGSRDDFAHISINDIGLDPVLHATTQQPGFNIIVGGYMSIKRIAHSIPLNLWLPATKDGAVDTTAAVLLCRAILRIFRDEGGRNDRQKARLMWLVEEYGGGEQFREAVMKEMHATDPATAALCQTAQQGGYSEAIVKRDVLGVHSQVQEGLSWVGVRVPAGRMSAFECFELARVAEEFSGSELRLTAEQNVILPNVPNAQLPQLLASPLFQGRLKVYESPTHNDLSKTLVSCAGSQFCPLAMVETKKFGADVAAAVDEILHFPNPVRFHVTGCPNSCGQAQVGDIGLMGAPAKKLQMVEGKDGVMVEKAVAVPGVQIFTGGTVGEEHEFGKLFVPDESKPKQTGVPSALEDLVPVLTKILIEQHGAVLKK